jgi:hypothetical protein
MTALQHPVSGASSEPCGRAARQSATGLATSAAAVFSTRIALCDSRYGTVSFTAVGSLFLGMVLTNRRQELPQPVIMIFLRQGTGRIFFFGFLHAIINATFISKSAFGSGYELVAIARSVAFTGRFADPYAPLATGLTAHSAPLYPVFLAIPLWLSHHILALGLTAIVINAAAFGFLLALLPLLSERLWSDRNIGHAAAWFSICLPVFGISAQFESIFVAAALGGFCLSSLRPQRSLRTGFLAALAILLSPAALPWICVWITGLTRFRLMSPRSTMLIATVVVILCLPWSLRNHLHLDTFSLRDNFPLELQVYNNDLAQASFVDSAAARTTFHPNESRDQAESVRRLGEHEYGVRKLTQAVAWIRQHPRRFLTLCAQRFFMFWFPVWTELPFAPLIWFVSALSFPAVVYSLRSKSRLPILLAAATVAYSAVYMFVGAELRYCEPILWVTILFAAKSALQIWQSAQSAKAN